MARTERILAIDIGATSIKVGEFEYPPRETLRLIGFTHREYEEELTEGSRSIVVAGLLRQMLIENNFTCRRCVLSISGQAAFTRFVKLPPVAEEESRVRQIVEFEARQNVPFPMEEVIWDYQLIANPEADEMDVMFVVIKNEIVEQMTGAVQAVGLDPILVDVAPAACYNAARANHIGDTECAMILNIGGRSTNLLFADGSRFFARTIPIAGHSITQQIAKEFGIGLAEAEELKRKHGFVALGGAYAEPESEVAAAVSKIIRNVMARLHGEINRSISVYRAHQKGNRPVALYLTGGSSTMNYTDHFFAEKLRIDVHYLNPFQIINLGPGVDRQRLQEVAHMFSEVIGLGLRHRVQCPIEVSLVPETIRRQQALRRKKPYVFACLACILVILFFALLANQRRAMRYSEVFEDMEKYIEKLDETNRLIKGGLEQAESRRQQYTAVEEFLGERRRWPEIYNELFRLRPPNVWLVSVKPTAVGVGEGGGQAPGGGGHGQDIPPPDDMMFPGAGMFPGGGDGGGNAGGAQNDQAAGPTAKTIKVEALEIYGHSVMFSQAAMAAGTGGDATATGGVAGAMAPPSRWTRAPETAAEGSEEEKPAAEPPATPELAYLASLRASPLFAEGDEETRIMSYVPPSSVRNLSTFTITVRLAEAVEFYE